MTLPKTPLQWLLLLSLTGIGSAVLTDQFTPLPSLSTTSDDSETEHWQLKSPAKPADSQASYDQLRTKKPWGEGNENAPSEQLEQLEEVVEAVAGDRHWHFLGILTQAEQRYMLVRDKDNKVQRYQLNDTLPDGVVVQKIEAGQVELVLKNKADSTPELLSLYAETKIVPEPKK